MTQTTYRFSLGRKDFEFKIKREVVDFFAKTTETGYVYFTNAEGFPDCEHSSIFVMAEQEKPITLI